MVRERGSGGEKQEEKGNWEEVVNHLPFLLLFLSVALHMYITGHLRLLPILCIHPTSYYLQGSALDAPAAWNIFLTLVFMNPCLSHPLRLSINRISVTKLFPILPLFFSFHYPYLKQPPPSGFLGRAVPPYFTTVTYDRNTNVRVPIEE